MSFIELFKYFWYIHFYIFLKITNVILLHILMQNPSFTKIKKSVNSKWFLSRVIDISGEMVPPKHSFLQNSTYTLIFFSSTHLI